MGFTYYGPRQPCPICGSSAPDSKCSSNSDGWYFCHTNRDGFNTPPGYEFRRTSDKDQWGCYREEGHSHHPRHDHAPRSSGGTFTAPPRPKREDSPFCRFSAHSEPLCDAARSSLASSLGMPESVVDEYQECRYDGSQPIARPVYTMPEWGYDAAGAWVVVSVHVRDQDGGKKTYGDPDARVKRGLVCPPDWDRGGPIYVVEGATDALALRAMGLSVIGRPSNTGGGAFLAMLLIDHPGREVVIVAENDRKPDGRWPGREGTEKVAAEVARKWGYPVRVAALPEGTKDSRAWFVVNWKPGTNPLRLDEPFRKMLRADVRVFRPSDGPPKQPQAPNPLAGDQAVSTFDLQRLSVFFTSLPQTPQDRGPFYEAALAEQDAQARRNHRCHHCGRQRPVCQEHKATHAPRTIWVRCEKWTCTGCKTYLIARETRNAAFRLGSADSLYETYCTAKQYDTITKRLRRVGAEYLAVRDREGWYVVCSRRIDTSIPTTPEAALACFAARLDEFHGENRPARCTPPPSGFSRPSSGSVTNRGARRAPATSSSVA